MLAQLLNQFHDQPIVTANSHSFLNDTNQLQLNRSARYVHQDVNQFRSIENFDLPSHDDFQHFDDIYYGNAGTYNEFVGFFASIACDGESLTQDTF